MRVFVSKLRFRAAMGGAFLSAWVAWGAETAPQVTDSPGNREEILFLHLHWKTNAVTLIKAKVVAGTFKPSAEAAGGLVVQLQSEDGEVLHESRIARPQERLYEVGDPDSPGAITARRVTVLETEFSIRMPRKARARLVEFFEPTGASARAPVGLRSLGRITLPQ